MKNHTRSKLTMVTTVMMVGCLGLAAAWGMLALSGGALADPPPHNYGGGGGDGDDVPPGTIYFTLSGQLHTTNGDGSNKTPVPGDVHGEPSHDLHGGQRWFLQLREIAGDSYPSGQPRRELFAVREDDGEAFTVQLTDQPDLEPLPEGSASLFWGFVRWGIGDAEIS